MRRIAPIVLVALLAVPAAGARSGPQQIKTTIERAIARERAALDALEQTPPDWSRAKDAVSGRVTEDLLRLEVRGAVHDGAMDAASGARIRAAGKGITDADDKAFEAINRHDAAAAKAAIERGLALKQRVFLIVSGALETKRCSTEKPFDVYAIPEGYAGSYAEVYPHGIPKDATNVRVKFVDLGTGTSPPAQPFPGQTWTSTVKGYQPNGKFVVRVDLSGTGFGKPDANVRHWKVVVTYDC